MIYCDPSMMRDFLLYLDIERGYSSHTLTAYQSDLTQFLSIFTSSVPLTQECLTAYLVTLKASHKSEKTINRHCSVIRSFLQFLKREDIIQKDHTLQLPVFDKASSLPKYYQNMTWFVYYTRQLKRIQRIIYEIVHY